LRSARRRSVFVVELGEARLRFIGYFLRVFVRRSTLSKLCCKSTKRSAKRSSISVSFTYGRLAGFVVDKCAGCFRFIVILLGHRNRLSRVPDLYAKRTTGGCDAEILIAEATDNIKRLLRSLLLSETDCVRLDLRLDRSADLRRRTKIAVRGDTAVDPLVRTLEVVVLDEELDSPKSVGEVCEDGFAKEFLPERFPKPFDLSERLGMLRPALAVRDAAPPK
jgi:hypothetical protein